MFSVIFMLCVFIVMPINCIKKDIPLQGSHQPTFTKWNSVVPDELPLFHLKAPLSNHSPVKDIHDFYGVHCDWLKETAVALVVHHHHEEITTRDLLNHKWPVDHSTNRQKIENDQESSKERKLKNKCKCDTQILNGLHFNMGYKIHLSVCLKRNVQHLSFMKHVWKMRFLLWSNQ